MRNLTLMAYDDARATLQEAAELQRIRGLTQREAAIVFRAAQEVAEAEDGKERRRERWARRKRQSKARFWRDR